jgi:DNA uptake protein ComE-like DNA-binding protein
MMFRRTLIGLFSSQCIAALLLVSTACNSNSQDQRSREEKTRDEAAKIAERAKPQVEEARRQIDQAAEDAEREARAAAQGAREGWQRSPSAPLDLNSASQSDLRTLPGISDTDARKIIDGRPYSDRHDLLKKGILSEPEYTKIRDRVTTK